jgi:hypothetical protein
MRNTPDAHAAALAVLNEHAANWKIIDRVLITPADLLTLADARTATGKVMADWPALALFVSVDTLAARYADMTEAERVEECHAEHLSGWFEEQGDDEADEEGEFLSTPSHYWPEGTETKAPSPEDYRDALEHCARGGLLAVTL